MTRLKLSLACGDYDRTDALRDGTVRPEGIDLTYVTVPAGELFQREATLDEFDVLEMSLSSYLMAVSRGDDRYVAIPVFPSRVFRHRDVFVSSKAGVKVPSDLKGRRVGVHYYAMTLALWIRGMLADEHGIRAEDVTWVKAGVARAGAVPWRWTFPKPERIRVEVVTDLSIDEMLVSGEIAAALLPYPPPSMTVDGPIRRLFTNVRDVQREYYRRTRIFPIMHVVAIRRPVYDRDPWVAQSLLQAFELAKARCYTRIANTGGTSFSILPFFQLELEDTIEEFGPDFWPYGLRANRHVLEAAVRYSHEQGISPRRVSVDELFPTNAVEPLSRAATDVRDSALPPSSRAGEFVD